MKRFLHLITIVLVLCCTAVSVQGCRHKFDPDNTGEKKPEKNVTADVVRNNIDKLAKSSWDKENYTAIHDDQIKPLKDADTKKSLTKKLDDAYAAVMVKEGNELMNDKSCSANHKRLNALMAELKKDTFNKADGAQEVITHYNRHQTALGYASKIVTNVKAQSWQSKYDKANEKKVRNEAKAHIAANPNCSAIKSSLSETTLNKKFRQRRESFCRSLAQCFAKDKRFCTNQSKAQELEDYIADLLGRRPQDLHNIIFEKVVEEKF